MRSLVAATLLLFTACSEDNDDGLAPDTTVTALPALSNEARVAITFSEIGNANGFICQFDTGLPFECISPFETDVADGPHMFSVAAKLNAKIDETPATTAWTTDITPPDTALLSGPAVIDNSVTAEFTFEGTDTAGAVTFECSLDGAAFAACSSPHQQAVTEGSRVFAVRSKDAAGNVDGSPATLAWTVDTTAPDTTITSGPANASSSGATVAFEFTSPESEVTFECSKEGAAFVACNSGDSFTYTAGPATFAVRAKDASGIVDPTPAMRSWTVDLTAPAVTITATPTNPSNDTTPTFEFMSPDPTASFECQIDGVVTFTSCQSPWTGPTVGAGNRTFRVRATDPIGNSATDTHAWVVDLTPPTVSITGGPTGVTGDATPTFTFMTGGTPATTQCHIDSGALVNCSAMFTATTLGDGPHTFEVIVTDAAGNAANATRSFTVDTTPPTVTITGGPTGVTSDRTPTFTFMTGGSPATTQCHIGTGTLVNCASGTFTAATLGDGPHTFEVVVTDAVGNAANATRSFTVDGTAPTVSITSGPTGVTNDTTPTFGFTTGGSPTSTQCHIDSQALVNCAGSFTSGTLGDGPHTFQVIVTDAAGNSNNATRSFTVDSTGPNVIFDDVPPATWPVDFYNVVFHGSEPGASFECSITGGAFAPCSTTLAVTNRPYNITQNVRVRATDAAGNTGPIATTTWTPRDGLVLHYPWEQGRTHNTSLLAQRPAYSPDGPAAAQAFLGGWAGTALGSTVGAHTYAGTAPALSSAGTPGTYTVSFWIRTNNDVGNGTLMSTLGSTGGFRVTIQGNQITVVIREGTSQFTGFATLPMDRWASVALVATGPGKGLQIYVDGMAAGNVDAPNGTGFDAGQGNLVVGPFSNLDLDDLRFYNVSITGSALCNMVARGFTGPQGLCIPGAPGVEMDFERGLAETGFWGLSSTTPRAQGFYTSTLGQGFQPPSTVPAWGVTGFRDPVANAPGHSVSLWFHENGSFGPLINFVGSCVVGGPPACGIRIDYSDNGVITIFAGTDAGVQHTKSYAVVRDKPNSIVITEQKTDPKFTDAITIYVNGVKLDSLPIGAGNLFEDVADGLALVQAAGGTLDEVEVWQTDLSNNDEWLCENGFDGEHDPTSGACLLTSN